MGAVGDLLQEGLQGSEAGTGTLGRVRCAFNEPGERGGGGLQTLALVFSQVLRFLLISSKSAACVQETLVD